MAEREVAVLGGRGMLGTALEAVLRGRGIDPVVLDLPDFDICREQDLAAVLRRSVPVINCAAYTNVDRAETEPALADAVNAQAVGVLGRLAAEQDVSVLHISTDFVFDGRSQQPWREADPPAPLSVYGASKLAGEQALTASRCRSVIVRLQWTYGDGGNHFISKCLAHAREDGELRVVTDQVGSPTWTRDAAEAIVDLLESGQSGVFHYAAAGYASRFEVAEFVLRELGSVCRVIPCRTDEFPAAARRPLNSRFNCDRIDAVLKRSRPAWQDSIREFLAGMATEEVAGRPKMGR